ncbi:serine/threonine-protein kinase [Streptomyces sp900129855]|uniref:non-specific serine/threonine protein kinase n=1 Tax=Streptomyces sp. 900129855 TaxID=3155129 RepID=A0ABV2ZAM9_9ACTN
MTGRYRLVESIGQGGMGRVWRAADEVLDRQVAVKEMRIDGLDPEDTRTRRERTLREARATARIDHPNVVRVYDVVDEGERLWIVMELVAGRSLERIMAEEGPLGPAETARIGLGLVTALRQVHARGVLHRDIKPGNVLVEEAGSRERGERRIVLTDFGIAAIQDAKALTMVGMLVGSPDYMAPERISGRPQGPPSDVWSLGATLCAALAGHSPFSRDTTLATLHAVLYEDPQLPSNAGPLRDVLASLLEKEPTVRAALTDLESTLAPIAHPPPTSTLTVDGAGTRPPDPRDPRRPEPRQPDAERPEDARPGPERVGGTAPPAPPQPPVAPTPPTPAASPASPASPEPSEASTEAASELRSESGSEPPSPSPSLPPAPSPSPSPSPRPRPGVSLVRADALTESRPGPDGAPARQAGPVPRAHPYTDAHADPHAQVRPDAETRRREIPPGGELPGPPVPSGARRRRGSRRPGHRAPFLTGRRAGVLAAVGVVAVGAVVAIVLTSAPGSHDGGDQAGGSSPIPSPATATAATTPAPTTPAPTPSTSSTPLSSPTVEGTFRPPSLPPGAHQEAGGFAWATPRGWRRDVKTGAEVHYTSPDGTQELVAKSSLARGDLMDTWRTSEHNAHQGQDYRKIRLEETTFRGRPAVVWEYTFTLQGTPWHARLLGFDDSGKSYQINTWYQPETETTALKTYEKVKDSFTLNPPPP